VLAVRLVTLLSGRAGVTPALCELLAARLDDGFTPAVPRRHVGGSGDVIPLAHAFQTLLGVGRVLGTDGETVPATDALAARGVEPYQPEAKEGIALLAGAPATVAVALGAVRAARVLARQAVAAAACAIDVARAPLDPYSAAVGRLSGDPLLADILARLRALLDGAAGSHKSGQAPVSFRVAPQVLVHLERTRRRLREDTGRALAAVSDSPVLVDGRFVASGEFHAVQPAAGMDEVATALIRTAELSAQRSHRLLDGRVTGLPDQLTPVPGPRCGLVLVHKRAVGACNELRRLAAPASVGLVDTSLGQEDAMTFAFEAAERLRRVAGLVRDVLACELLCARQAWWLRGEAPARGLEPTAGALADAVEPVDEDRPLGPDVDALAAALAAGRLPVGAGGPDSRRG
jgi:histidine ammonia-lyase